jgi:hypothetical protein
MISRRRLVASLVVLGLLVLAAGEVYLRSRVSDAIARGVAGTSAFEVKPYLQLGNAPRTQDDGLEKLELLWQTTDREVSWSVEVRPETSNTWAKTSQPRVRRVAVEGLDPFRVYHAALEGLEPGGAFSYRVLRAGEPLFEASARARKRPGQPQRIVLFGDCAAGTEASKAIAYQAFQARPDYVVIPGDIVYARGRVSEYRAHYFSVYNADVASPDTGAPLIRSTVFLAAPGNHDLAVRDLDRFPDALAYFYYWSQPLNGPLTRPGVPGTPVLQGTAAHQRAFLDTSTPGFPRMANFSLDYGDVHWTMIDGNDYTDWTEPALRDWLQADLAAAGSAAWRFVVFHQPSFNSSKTHFDDQRMRVVTPVLEDGKVDLVFSGHVHNYQRTHPLRFAFDPPKNGNKPYDNDSRVDGKWTLDPMFDGVTHTRPDGVIYVVTGAGGAKLYNPEQSGDPASWQPFTRTLVSAGYSLTVVDVTTATVTVRQVTPSGAEIDKFVVSHQ